VHRYPAALIALALLARANVSLADPQAGAALTVGGGVVGLEPDGRKVAVFHLGVRADLLLLRERDRDMGIGPYVEVGTEAFQSLALGGGAEWLVPVTESFPLVLSAGATARGVDGAGWEPGLSAAAFFGSRGYNFHSWYGLTGGVFVLARRSLGATRDTDLIAGLELDLSLFAYPWIFLYNALR
jgi:hypothetical protein